MLSEWRHLVHKRKANIRVLDMPILDTTNKANGLIGQVIAEIVLQLLSFIPERIDGLPVRKIMPAAFSLCQSLTSVSIPSTVREVGERAFSWCTALTNVTFAEGTAAVGGFAFTNCVSLKSVTFPKSLSFIGPGCFARCESLESVTFQGDAPRLDHSYRATDPYLGEKLTSYNGFAPRFKAFVPRTAFGWVRPYVRGVPEKWPVGFGWMNAYPVEGYDIEKPRGFLMSISKARDN